MLGFYNYTVALTYVGMLVAFAGVTFAMDGKMLEALFCLMLAGVCDMFDGKIASTMERTKQEKRFGVQIDSLSDLVSFGVLPAVIVYATSPDGKFTHAIAGFYLLCALIRLAWFNVNEEERQDASSGPRESYLGLPVTTSAFFLPTILGVGYLRDWELATIGTAVLGVMALAFLTPFSLRKPKTAGMIGMLMFGCFELLILLTGIKK